MELTCGQCGRSSYVPDELVQGRAFRAKCPDCESLLEIPAERPNALDDKDLAWLSAEAKAKEAEPPAPPPPKVTEQAVAQYERRAGAERRRHGVAVAAAALLLAAAAAGVLVLVSARKGAGPFSKRARAERGAEAAETYDAAGLAAKPKIEEPAPAPAPVPAAPARKRTARISRSDRKLLDLLARKDDAAVVAPEGDAMDSAAAGLDADAVSRTVAANRKAFDTCVSKALRLNPSLRVAKRATLVVTVQPDGSVTGAFIAEEDVDRSDLGGCLSGAARRMVFPAFDGEATDVSLPLSLSAGF
ncbi:MAG TPA: AgmX/PglI C-terminal domain-containing protein [Anaeromyxobacter sp.]